MGRKSTFNQKDAAEIAARLSKGEPLAVICRDEWLPHDNTVRDWAAADPEFAVAIARAREAGFDQIALDALAIADEVRFDTKAGPNDTEQCNSEWISRSKLRVETRLKLLAKWDPKRYGDKTTTELTGPNGGPIQTEATANELASLPKEKRDAIRAAIKAAMGT
jgi:hypothetical protein